IRVARFVNQKDVEAREITEQRARRAIRERGVHLVEKILSADEAAPIAVLQRLEQQRRGESRLTDAGRSDEDDVLGLRDEFHLREGAHLLERDARLLLERKRLQRPLLRKLCAVDAP